MEEEKSMKKRLALLLALVMTLSLCACGSAAKTAQHSSAAGSSVYTSESSAAYDAAPMAAAEEAYWDGDADYGLSVSNSASSSAAETDVPDENPEKIIYSADVTVETTDFDASLQTLDKLVKEYGGWVESSSVSGANFYNQSRGNRSARNASYTLRIPGNRFDELMNGLSALGNVPYTHVYTENVTAQYFDVQARLTAYRTQETRLLEMMEVAESVEDIILLEDRLTELRYQIESLQSTLNNWDRRVSYSTVSLELQEVWEYTPEPETKLSYGRELWLALLDGVRGLGSFLGDLLILLASLLPALIVIGILCAILIPVIKKRRAKRKAAKEARRAAMLGQTAAPVESAPAQDK